MNFKLNVSQEIDYYSKKFFISNATVRNWEKLNIKPEDRLTARANKKNSNKKFLPTEYFNDTKNISFVQSLIDYIELKNFDINSVIFSLAINLLTKKNLQNKSHVKKILSEYCNLKIIPEFLKINLPENEIDILGIIYQSYLNEGKKNILGSYYTPKKIIENMTRNFNFSEGQNFLDPCCGSGAFLISIPAKNPNQIFGIDNDEIAVLIAKVNLLIKYKNFEFTPQIYCTDFLQENNFDKKFDYISTNPPWGAVTKNIKSKESFSSFFVKSFNYLKNSGTIKFLFPESVLNVATHKDFRKFILENTNLISVTKYAENFSGVTTKYVDIECQKKSDRNFFYFISGNQKQKIFTETISATKNLIFNFLCDEDISIINSVKSKGKFSLRESIWALGIVTGDNKNKIFQTPAENMEKIYTGKEIQQFSLKPAKNYIVYDRKNFQQVASDEIYRADEKLVYKFISKKLIFSYDDTKSLFLNSANILIPKIPSMNIKTVMAFLNSNLFQFLYMKMFGEIKILKNNLLELPFPQLADEENIFLKNLVEKILEGDIDKKFEIDKFIFEFYNISESQENYVRSVVSGKID